MNKNKKAYLPRKQGFTVIEILVVVAIIAILATVLLVSMNGSRKKAQDNSALTSFKSAAAPVYMCLTSGLLLNAVPAAGQPICPGDDAVWPDFTKFGWSNTVSTNLSDNQGFYWCDVTSDNSSIPALTGTVGGDKTSGNFCFMLKNGDEYMWCTISGCSKQGF